MSRRNHHRSYGDRDRQNQKSSRNERNERSEYSEKRLDRSDRRDISRKPLFKPSRQDISQEEIKKDEERIKNFKTTNQFVCTKCGVAITDITSAIADKSGNGCIHFDCALEAIGKEEKLESGDKITYIGNGRFGIVNFPNVHDMKHFTIKKIIEWENKDTKASWRSEMADLYSQVK